MLSYRPAGIWLPLVLGLLLGLLEFRSSLFSLSCKGPTKPAPEPPCITDITEGPLDCTAMERPLLWTAMDCELHHDMTYFSTILAEATCGGIEP